MFLEEVDQDIRVLTILFIVASSVTLLFPCSKELKFRWLFATSEDSNR